MKRVLVVLVLVFSLAGLMGCSSPAAKPAATPAPTGAAPAPAAPNDPYAAIPTDGAHEKAAAAAIPAALKEVTKVNKDSGRETPDVSGATPTLYSYTLMAKVGDRLAMFEVRLDGKAHELYAYSKEPDPAKLQWQNAANAEGTYVATPEGERETAAASAVKAVMDKAAPGETAVIQITGYEFCFVKDGKPVEAPNKVPFTISIDPKGGAGSWSL